MSDVAPIERDAGGSALKDDAPHLLVVDDDRRIRELLARFVAKGGYRVTLAGNAAEAASHLTHFAFDLIILDAMMPGRNGFDIAADRERHSSVPILMLTARADADDRVRGHEAGADDYQALRATRTAAAHRLYPATVGATLRAEIERGCPVWRLRLSGGSRRVAPG